MHVALMIDHLRMGGAQRILVQLSLELQKRGIDITVISNDDRSPVLAEQLRKAEIPVKYFPGKSLTDLTRLRKLVNYLRSNKIDVIHSNLTYSNILGSIAGKLAGVPVIVSMHSTDSDKRNFNIFHLKLESWILRRYTQVILAHGNAIAEAHQQRFRKKEIEIIPNTVKVFSHLSESERNLIRRELIPDKTSTILISVGRMSLPKGYKDLICAFSRINRKYARTYLVIVGDGFLRDELEEYIRELKLEDQILLVGQREDVPILLGAADIYVSASHWEGMSVAILEAMSAGLPVVATEVGDNSRVITKETGLLVPPKDIESFTNAIERLLLDRELRKKMGLAGKARIEKEYNFSSWADKFVDLYERVEALN